MKKNLFFALCLALTSLAFVACSDDDDSTPAAPQLKPIAEEELAVAGSYEIQEANSPYRFVEFTEQGTVILETAKLGGLSIKTRGAEESQYIVGTFEWDGTKYTVYVNGQVFCYITIEPSTGGKFNIKITIPGQDPVEVEGTKNDKADDTDLTTKMCRSWKIANTRIRHTKAVTAVRQFEGCNLNEILEYAKTKATINEDFAPNKVITEVILTRSGSFYIFYANGDDDFGKWTWKDESKGLINYTWREANMGNRFESGEATFDVRNNKYCLTLAADIDDDKNQGEYNVELSFYLSEK